MIRIRYSSEPTEVELSGSRNDLLGLRNVIVEMTEDQLSVPADTDFDPTPYPNYLEELVLQKTDDELCIKVLDKKLTVCGRHGYLALFAENLPYDTDEQDYSVPYHVHFDRIGRESQVAENSLDAVLTLRG